MQLYSYFRSSAAYRVRIALNIKGLDYDYLPVNLLQQEHNAERYLARNPQGLVPALQLDSGEVLAQSVAILEWLEETCPEPALLPLDPLQRARIRSMVNSVCCDIHPLCNVGVLNYLREHYQVTGEDLHNWFSTWMHRSFRPIEQALAASNSTYSFGETPCMADVLLVPQVFNARRFAIALDDYPHLQRVVDNCGQLPAFAAAAPERQPDASG
ncbi:maleylacetoacetate isomerase [Seongchinamella sediminis]|uniref:Maleylacetoacetate isomerase n=1 Tax=Seongchinamella sediminis TaxID=2283635 RepID=A0A3L7E2T4_9GAMM|nr:maleylacetoacetate isomerase [Seongchinamella sediminis]RLQ23175.1 maleylacetoacetate isomerase [Seongchinamella sediminis]